MKRIGLLLLAIIASFSAVFAQNQNDSFIQHVDAATFKKVVESGNGIILDVRTPQEVAAGHIANASVINFYDADFEQKINLMQKDKEIYVYCRSGARSSQAANLLQKNGFKKVYNLQGGIGAWEKKGYAITQPTNTEDTNIQTMTVVDLNSLLKENKVVFIDFHTQWCSPCRKMAPVVDELEKEYSGKVVVKRIDVDKSKDIAKEYQVSGVPVFTLFVGGNAVWTHNGMIAKEAIVQELNQVLKK
jgi:thioredoxin 1